ncbi:hypothetical protein Taro_036908 [Colocasia esculenta]|uniref:CDC20/Fizzy WD40 domain-containing protein n=1 Tax=Colocasia esculenta TaxID=4460 RepID=A0A843WJ67_COLES|nr:hypothetical protein [Colocasia esculenta]
MEGLRGDQQWWHSPPLPRNDDPVNGDRFIPTRSLMNMDLARSSLIPRSGNAPPETFPSPAKQAYRRFVEQNLTLDSEGKTFKMLVFKGSPRKSGGRLLLVDEMLHEDLGKSKNRPPRIRTVPTSADKVLDAPNLADDYYLNLMDWGQKNILAIALGQSLYLWNAANGGIQELLNVGSDELQPTSVRWSADGEKLAVGFMNATIEIWDAASARQVRKLEGHTGRVSSLSWNHNLLSSGSRDTSIINHDARASSSSASRFQAHTSDVCGLRWSGSGNLLASGGNDNLVCVWEASNRRPSRPLHRLEGHSAAVRALAWCPFQSNVLASGGGTEDRCIKLWNTQTGNCTGSADGGSQVCALEWNRHRKEILSAHGFVHNQLCLWSYPSMSKIGELKGHAGRVLHLAQSPDGSTVASAGADETLRFWNVFGPPPARTGERLRSSLLSMNGAHIR